MTEKGYPIYLFAPGSYLVYLVLLIIIQFLNVLQQYAYPVLL